MFGSGAATGKVATAAVARRILKVLRVGPTACFVAVATMTKRGTAACRIVATTRLTTGTTALGCAWLLRSNKLSDGILCLSESKKKYEYLEKRCNERRAEPPAKSNVSQDTNVLVNFLLR